MSTPPRQTFNTISLGRKIALGAGIVLVIACVMPWFGVETGLGTDVTVSGVNSGLFGWLALLCGGLLAALAALPLLGVANPVPNQRPGNLALGLAGGALVFSLLNMFANNSEFLDVEFGFYLAFLAGIAAVAGAWLMRQAGE